MNAIDTEHREAIEKMRAVAKDDKLFRAFTAHQAFRDNTTIKLLSLIRQRNQICSIVAHPYFDQYPNFTFTGKSTADIYTSVKLFIEINKQIAAYLQL